LAYKLAKANGCSNPFKEYDEMAQVDWLYNFLSQHADISLVKPKETSASHGMGFNKVPMS
jgi:hypothetical protein